jgi:hypothetical protein
MNMKTAAADIPALLVKRADLVTGIGLAGKRLASLRASLETVDGGSWPSPGESRHSVGNRSRLRRIVPGRSYRAGDSGRSPRCRKAVGGGGDSGDYQGQAGPELREPGDSGSAEAAGGEGDCADLDGGRSASALGDR